MERIRQAGGTVVEFVVVAPTLLMMALAMLQVGLVMHAKSALNLAANEAARAGSLHNADPLAMRDGLARGLAGYFAAGTDTLSLLHGRERAAADLLINAQIEILSPTHESFDDHASVPLQQRLGIDGRVIPVSQIAQRPCQATAASACEPATNHSGQTLADATLLKIRVTWGLPEAKQVPMAGRFWIWALEATTRADPDTFRNLMSASGRIPIVAQATIRMQSPPIENLAMASNGGSGNQGTPENQPLEPSDPLPSCPFYNPSCVGVPPDGSGNDPPYCPGA
ncbi:hypothetical protein BH09PSE6_BH09PSE6_06410 [soil metagenome]